MDLKEAVKRTDSKNFSEYGWNFGGTLIDYEFSKQLSQEDVAKMIGVSLGDFSLMELGISKFSDGDLKKMKRRLK